MPILEFDLYVLIVVEEQETSSFSCLEGFFDVVHRRFFDRVIAFFPKLQCNESNFR